MRRPRRPPAAPAGRAADRARGRGRRAGGARAAATGRSRPTLAISERTVERHIVNILDKLGFATRVQVATWAVDQGLAAPSRRAPA